eukprot:UN09596
MESIAHTLPVAIGDKVILANLSREDLNNLTGNVLEFLPQKHRYVVKLDNDGSCKLLRGCNLLIMPISIPHADLNV